MTAKKTTTKKGKKSSQEKEKAIIRGQIGFKKAFKEYAQNKPWEGTISQRKEKMLACHDALNANYAKEIRLEFEDVDSANDKVSGASGGSYYDEDDNKIVMKGKLSVITFMARWIEAIGDDVPVLDTTEYLFKKIFPLSGAHIEQRNGMLVDTRYDNSNEEVESDEESETDA